MKPQIISYQAEAFGISALIIGSDKLEVKVSELWQPEWWQCQQHTTITENRHCWLEKGRHWNGTATITSSGRLLADGGLADWLALAGRQVAEAARDLLGTELARMAKVPMVIHRQLS